jgi:alkylation response protein AidB-like acyl-CoA dehydrogenase
MEPALTSDQEFFAETTRRFLDDKSDSATVRALRDDPLGFEPATWRQGCELGWTSLAVGEGDGGGTISGDGVSDLALVAFEFGRHAAPGPLMATNIVASVLGRSGTAEQKETVLRRLLSGESIASWAYAEPRPNDRLGRVTVAATERAGRWQLDGRKVAVEHGNAASHLLVTARADGGLVQFLVPSSTDGVTIHPMGTVDLTHRFASVTFDAAQVGADAVVGRPAEAEADVRRQLQLANVLQCAEMVGAMDKAFEITVEWAFNRYSFGRPLASYQALKHRFADMKTWLEASHAIADAAARSVGAGDPDADELVSGAKAYIGHYGPELCHECVQLHGGIGVTHDHDMHLYVRRVTLNALLYGTVDDHRLRLTEILEQRENAGGEAA